MGTSGRCKGCFFLAYKKYDKEKLILKAEKRVEDLEFNFEKLNWIEVYNDLRFSELRDESIREKMSDEYKERFKLVILDIKKLFKARKTLRGKKLGIRNGLEYEIDRALSDLNKI